MYHHLHFLINAVCVLQFAIEETAIEATAKGTSNIRRENALPSISIMHNCYHWYTRPGTFFCTTNVVFETPLSGHPRIIRYSRNRKPFHDALHELNIWPFNLYYAALHR